VCTRYVTLVERVRRRGMRNAREVAAAIQHWLKGRTANQRQESGVL
jgi:hypothetical protein